ncbi:hypothetical protein AB0I30_29825 [Nocardia tengchongensis]|uniref:DUF6892 domain-containing protein n=1 Tax=Nocardia tengchongensis TaxID=2055889 RepID=UPI00340A2E91
MTEFMDFNLKLAVIEELMYGEDPKLAPWSLEETLAAQGFSGDLWQYSFDNFPDQVVPEAARTSRASSSPPIYLPESTS